jgi:hypothetical protein
MTTTRALIQYVRPNGTHDELHAPTMMIMPRADAQLCKDTAATTPLARRQTITLDLTTQCVAHK